jgi:hypothetical protein
MYPHCNHTLRSAPSPLRGEGWGEGAWLFTPLVIPAKAWIHVCGKQNATEYASTIDPGLCRDDDPFLSLIIVGSPSLTLSPQGRGNHIAKQSPYHAQT